MMHDTERKKIAATFLELGLKGKFRDGLHYFSPECRTHNPYIAGDIEVLTSAMDAANSQGSARYPNAEFRVRSVLEDGDLVAVHSELLSNMSKPSEGGLRQVHLFRFRDNKIVEYWDITQQVLPDMPNAGGAF